MNMENIKSHLSTLLDRWQPSERAVMLGTAIVVGIGAALRRMAPRDLSRLPVVSRDDPLRLVGLVRRNDVVRAYGLGVAKRRDVERKYFNPHEG